MTYLIGEMQLVDDVIFGAGCDELNDVVAGKEVRLDGQNAHRLVLLHRFAQFLHSSDIEMILYYFDRTRIFCCFNPLYKGTNTNTTAVLYD